MSSENILEIAKRAADEHVRKRIDAINAAYSKLRESVEIDIARTLHGVEEQRRSSERVFREAAMKAIQDVQDDLQMKLTHMNSMLDDLVTAGNARRDILIADLDSNRTKAVDELSERLVDYINKVDNMDYDKLVNATFEYPQESNPTEE